MLRWDLSANEIEEVYEFLPIFDNYHDVESEDEYSSPPIFDTYDEIEKDYDFSPIFYNYDAIDDAIEDHADMENKEQYEPLYTFDIYDDIDDTVGGEIGDPITLCSLETRPLLIIGHNQPKLYVSCFPSIKYACGFIEKVSGQHPQKIPVGDLLSSGVGHVGF